MDRPEEGKGLAIAAEALYLVNLMVVPVGGFVVIAWLWLKHHRDAAPLARCHLDQTFFVSLWGGVLLVLANALLILLGGYDRPWTWVVVILYFTTVHTTLICFGALGLARAIAGQRFRYPLIGPRCD